MNVVIHVCGWTWFLTFLGYIPASGILGQRCALGFAVREPDRWLYQLQQLLLIPTNSWYCWSFCFAS